MKTRIITKHDSDGNDIYYPEKLTGLIFKSWEPLHVKQHWVGGDLMTFPLSYINLQDATNSITVYKNELPTKYEIETRVLIEFDGETKKFTPQKNVGFILFFDRWKPIETEISGMGMDIQEVPRSFDTLEEANSVIKKFKLSE